MSELFDETYWEERYRSHGRAAGHGRPPSPYLVAEAGALTPGRALDAGCGEGADASWLASHGWRVTAVDVSVTALDRARERAREMGAEAASLIEWVHADLGRWAPPERRFDLVTTHYVHAQGPREALFARLASAVAPGGTLLVVGHHPDDRHSDAPHASAPGSHLGAEEVAAVLDPDAWHVGTADARSRSVTVRGRRITMRDAVLVARRAE